MDGYVPSLPNRDVGIAEVEGLVVPRGDVLLLVCAGACG